MNNLINNFNPQVGDILSFKKSVHFYVVVLTDEKKGLVGICKERVLGKTPSIAPSHDRGIEYFSFDFLKDSRGQNEFTQDSYEWRIAQKGKYTKNEIELLGKFLIK